MDRAPAPDFTALTGTAAAFLLLILAYQSGHRIKRMRRATDLAIGGGKPLPPTLQWHMLWGFATGMLFLLGDLTVLSSGNAGWVHPATLAGLSLIILSGAARAFLGGSGRLHLASAAAGLLIFLFRVADFGRLISSLSSQ